MNPKKKYKYIGLWLALAGMLILGASAVFWLGNLGMKIIAILYFIVALVYLLYGMKFDADSNS